ncbi:MAG: hypoxanthine/guanine phosphoribosyltransferase [Natrialbaceae archaeon]|nr:hypoxanthine/guanine phosphoribosyltransferase [Natrialbaceae archaeon]
MNPALEPLAQSLREAPVVERNDYDYFVHGVTDGVPLVEPDVLQAVADGMADVIDVDAVDLLVAPEAMGIHHATALSLETDLPFVVVRKREYGFPDEQVLDQQTSYGEDTLYLNGVEPGDRVVLVDDVYSSGGTLETVYAGLEAAGAEILDVIVVIRRVDVADADLSFPVTSLLEVRVDNGSVEVVSS